MTGPPDLLLYGLYGAIFLAVLLAVDGVQRLVAGRRAWRATVARRMGRLESSPVAAADDPTPRLRRAHMGVWPVGGVARWIDRLVRQAGLEPGPGPVLAGLAGGMLAAVLAVAALVAGAGRDGLGAGALALTAGAAFAAGAGAPLLYLRRRAAARLRAFEAQLPDALDLIARGLRAGHPVNVAMASVAREYADPLGGEFAAVVDEMTYGLDLREALANLARRVDVPDLRYVVVAIGIQHETGGNLAQVLHGLTSIMRARMRLHAKVRALTAEARLSGKMLAAMPLLFAGLVLAGNPDFYAGVVDDPLFMPILGGAFALEVAGILIMRRLTRLRM